jgi:hypothetical protein
MEIGRETPESAVCARLLEEGCAVVLEGLGGLRRAIGLRMGLALRTPVRPLDD